MNISYFNAVALDLSNKRTVYVFNWKITTLMPIFGKMCISKIKDRRKYLYPPKCCQ